MAGLWFFFAGCVPDDPSSVPQDTPVPVATGDTAGPEPVGAAPVWTDAPLATLIHARSFQVSSALPGTAEVRCSLAEDPDEVHTVRSSAVLTAHELVVYGLLASATYDCELEMLDQVTARSFTTGPIENGFPVWTTVVTGDGGAGYTLLNHGTDFPANRQAKLIIVDQQGRLRWSYTVPYNAADLDASYLGSGQILYGGGFAAPPTVIGLAGEIALQAPPSSTGQDYHHHTERIATGEVVALTKATTTDGADTWIGFAIDILDKRLANRTWSWNSQIGVDAHWLRPAPAWQNDPYHLNAVQVDGDFVYLNLRQMSDYVKLDRRTGEPVWTLGPKRDFRLLDANGEPDDPANWFYMPHAPEKNGDHILFYDNGVGRPGGNGSRIVELAIDERRLTATMVWSYTEDGWYEPIWGDVDRLPNGRVMFVRAHSGASVPLWPDQRTEIVEVDPANNEVVWRMSFLDPHDAGYRAERIDGCAIFANQKYCP